MHKKKEKCGCNELGRIIVFLADEIHFNEANEFQWARNAFNLCTRFSFALFFLSFFSLKIAIYTLKNCGL